MSNPEPIVDSAAAANEPITLAPKSLHSDQSNPLLPLLERQRQAFLDRGISDHRQRAEMLTRLNEATAAYADELIRAVQADFGHRSTNETIVTEVLATMAEIRQTKGKIKKWMKPKRAEFSLAGLPGSGRLVYQPKGVVGIMGAWNYPVFLVLSPLVGVLAAGNHAMIKPPDVTPRTSDVLAEMIGKYFEPEYVTVVTGEVDTAIAFSELPFDHLMYTGNTEVGRKIMMAAAKNLTPVTLEMGGKSPTIVGEDYPVEQAAKRMLLGKCVNSGQTCIAPDYVMVPKGQEQAFADAWQALVAKRYPTLVDNDDVTWIVNERHYRRINGLIEDARAKGANVHQVNAANEQIPEGQRIIPPTVITNVNDDMKVMQEEIFGPVLPVMGYDSLDTAMRYVKEHPRPLALYYFDNDRKRADYVMSQTISGGATVNDTMLHIAHENLPFGGSGPSGLGAYHGFHGFKEFSHVKGVLYQRNWFSPSLFMARPYPKRAQSVLRRAIKLLS
ncbi:MAG: coniferyl aldehyde dehydrogenase [Pseudomonadota bacterium]|nr:coniferyl aldehyde dehydrogenase [Pseudomonadota bacterium]HJO34658.1 coniferyl aldehyde dehydrogenase [Gammaproteobacteria bacterium]